MERRDHMNREEAKEYIEHRIDAKDQVTLTNVRELQITMKEIKKMLEDQNKVIDPMAKWFQTFNLRKAIVMEGARIIVWLGGAVIAIGGAALIIKTGFQNWLK